LTINGNNLKARQSEDIDIQEMLNQIERRRLRRNATGDTSTVAKDTSKIYQQGCYHQLAERVRELEKEVVPDMHFFQVPQVYSPFSALTPCSNVSGGGFSNYSRSQNFPMNVLSPNSSVPTQRFGLSPRVLERAHQIPERFDYCLVYILMGFSLFFPCLDFGLIGNKNKCKVESKSLNQ
jgi:hypothetical protein